MKEESMKHLVCYSGGHSSALVAIEVVRKYGKDAVILLNHDIHPNVEDADIKRFKEAVAAYLEVEITYANHPEWDSKDQFDVVTDAQAFKVRNGTALCTHRLKTAPFEKYLKDNFPAGGCVVYYGFDKGERARILRRSSHLATLGYNTQFPLAHWESRTIHSTTEIGIEPPLSYSKFKHANCVGCLKAGRQHWYLVYCERQDIWEKAKATEDAIGYSIIKGAYLDELEAKFELMKAAGVVPTEHINPNTFWAAVGKVLGDMGNIEKDEKPCECVF